MNKRRTLFVKEYLKDLNATHAAIRAGYSEKAAHSTGPRMLENADVKAAIQEAMDKRASRVEISSDRVLRELSILGHYDPADIASAKIRRPEDIANLPEEVRRAIVGWKWDACGNFVLKLADKAQALSLIGKHLKLFTDKIEHSGRVTLEDLLADK